MPRILDRLISVNRLTTRSAIRQLFGGMRRGDSDGFHAAAPGRFKADEGVFEDDALAWLPSNPARRNQEDFRIRLAVAYVFRGGDGREVSFETGDLHDGADVLVRSR